MWETELGVTVSLENQYWSVFIEERNSGNFNIARGGWIADYNDPMCFLDMFVSGEANNDSHYANPAYDVLIEKAKNCADKEERMELMHQAEDIIMEEDSVVAPIFFYVQTYMQDDELTGWYYTPLGYFFFGTAHK